MVICSKCHYHNSYGSHYCVKCGALLPGYKEYVVIAKTELKSLRDERDLLREKINNSWGVKIKKIVGDHIDTIVWTACMVFWLIACFVLAIKCDSSQKTSEVIEIRKDEASGKYGIYNNESKALVAPYEYDSISHRKGWNYQGDWNFFYMFKNGKFVVADSTGMRTISYELNAASGSYNGLVILYKGGKQGLMNTYGQQILPCEYQYVLWEGETAFSSLDHPGTYVGNILPVKVDKNGGWELYNRSGRKIREQHYKTATQTGNPNLIKVREIRRDNKILYGIVDESGQVVIPCQYYRISVFGNDRAWAKQNYNDPWSLITSKGIRLMTLSNGVTPSAFHDGMAAVIENGKIGYCDTSGKIVIPMKYERVLNNDGSYMGYDFHSGKARVLYNGETGYVDKSGIFTPDKVK